jgi:O-antigen/teichoic acid export membrane protein
MPFPTPRTCLRGLSAVRPGWLARAASIPGRGALLREGAWVAVGQAGCALGVLVGNRLLTGYLAPDVFGAANLLIGLVMLGNTVFSVPVMQAGMRFYPEMKAHPGGIARLRAVMTGSLALTTALLIGLLLCGAACEGSASSAWSVFGLLAGLTVVDTWRTLETTLYSAARRQAPAALWAVLDAWAKPLAALAFVLVLGAGTVSILLGYVLASLVALGCFLLAGRREGTGPTCAAAAPRPGLVREFWAYTLPLLPMAVVSWIISASDRYIIGGMLGLGEAGLYVAAYGLATRPVLMAATTLETTVRPAYYEAVAAGDVRSERRLFAAWVGAVAVGCGLLTLLIALGRDWIVALLLGKAYGAAAPLLPWLALGSTFWALALVFQRQLFGAKRTRALLVLRTIAAAFTVVVMGGLTYLAGLRGAAISAVIYWGFELLLSVLFVRIQGKIPGREAAPVRRARHRPGAAALAGTEERDA